MSDDVTTAATIASLRAEVERLTNYAERLLAENVRLSDEAAELREDLANARKWIDGHDVRSDFPNATSMRQALDKERDEHANTTRALHNISKWVHGEDFRAEYPTATAMRTELIRHRDRAGVLEAEVRAWREAVNTLDMISEHPDHQHCISGEWDDGRKCDDCKLWSDAVRCRRETDRTHALDAAKFGGAT